jgi:hypothetical protein
VSLDAIAESAAGEDGTVAESADGDDGAVELAVSVGDGVGVDDDDGDVLRVGSGTGDRVYVGLGVGVDEDDACLDELVLGLGLRVGVDEDDVPRGVPGSTGGSFGLCAGGPCLGSGEVGSTGTVIPTPRAYSRSRLMTSRT